MTPDQSKITRSAERCVVVLCSCLQGRNQRSKRHVKPYDRELPVDSKMCSISKSPQTPLLKYTSEKFNPVLLSIHGQNHVT